ncbi:MAG: ABC transporter ATP-binding protein [Firmicutes bacterium]|nr:ABC transporter ATP-binding protein [Bacillota bacterium]
MSNQRPQQDAQRPGGMPMGRPGGGGGGWGGGPPGGIGVPVQKSKDFKGTLRRLLTYFRPHRASILTVFVAAILGTVFSILTPKILASAIDDIVSGVLAKFKGVPGAGVDFKQLLSLLFMLGGLYVFSSIFSYVQQYIMAGVAQRTVYEMRKQVMKKLAKLPVSFFDANPHGEILSRFVNDFDNISGSLQQSLTQLITAVVTFVGVLIMMLTISPLMTLVIALTLPLSFVVTKVIAKRSQGFFISRQRSLGELNGHVESMYTGHQIVKAFGHEDVSIETFNEINERLFTYSWKAQFVTGIIMPLMNFIGNIGYVLVSVIGGLLVTNGTIQIGDILAFIQYTRQFSQPITQLSSISNVIQSTIASSERIFELLDEKEEVPEQVSAEGQELEIRGDVAFQNVRFGYTPDVSVIEDLNIDVSHGQTIAIVGPTGAGKTTLVNLLMRFYELSGGQILIDGTGITEMKRGRLRRMFGMVLQDTWLFNGTIRDNIGYGRAGATTGEIVEAAQAAHADHFIRTLPDGYDTVLNEEASNISQGQRQLLTIARAILADPDILILDEATSSVDTRTEVHIQTAMKELMRGRTSFVIAHRLSTIREADLIVVMNHGRVIEQGTHLALLEQNGFYADLYNSQFSEAAVPEGVA